MGFDSLAYAQHIIAEAQQRHKLLLGDGTSSSQDSLKKIAQQVADDLAIAQDNLLRVVEERSELDQENVWLHESMEGKDSIVKYLDGYYSVDKDKLPLGDPYCLGCLERRHLLIHLIRRSPDSNCCADCGQSYLSEMTPFQHRS